MTDEEMIDYALEATGTPDTPENRAAYADLIARLRAADDPKPPAAEFCAACYRPSTGEIRLLQPRRYAWCGAGGCRALIDAAADDPDMDAALGYVPSDPLAAAIRNLPDLDPPDGWEARLLAAHTIAARHRRARRTALLYGLAALALGAVACLCLYLCR